jgi:outer membrane protein assembly factor BamB
MKLEFKENSLLIGDKEINFYTKKIGSAYKFENIVIIIFEGDYPQKDKNYNNAVALDFKSGILLWEIELDDTIDFNNPYEGVSDAEAYFIFFKANSGKYAVNKLNGKIIRNIDLMTGSRPW